MSKPITLIVLLALAVGAFVAAPASANKVLDDCSKSDTGLLKGRYTRGQLTGALSELDGDSSDYSNCYDAIRVALSQLRRAGSSNGDDGGGNDGSNTGGNGGSGGGSGFDDGFGDSTGGGSGSGAAGGNGGGGDGGSGSGEATSTSPQVPATSQPGSSAPVQLADTSVTPSVPAAIASDGNALPTPLIVLLALLGAGALAVAGTTIGRRALARRRD
jgi:hypothetical protein